MPDLLDSRHHAKRRLNADMETRAARRWQRYMFDLDTHARP